MKLSEFKEKIDLYASTLKPHNDPDVVVEVKMPFTTAGGTPSVNVKSIRSGFDWDNGKFFIVSEETVTLADAEFAAKFKKLQEDYGWAKIQKINELNINKKTEIRILTELELTLLIKKYGPR